MGLSQEDLLEKLPTQGQATYKNRIGWAKTYLKKAGLLENTKRAHVKITDLGLKVLTSAPEKIDNQFLMQFPSFAEFKEIKNFASDNNSQPVVLDLSAQGTPRELIDNAFELINKDLADEILDSIFRCSPKFFENLVVDLMISMGYGGSNEEAGKAIGRSSDGGIDGVINEDKLGLDTIYLQAKRWTNTVGAPQIRDFVGSLVGKQSNKGVFITTSKFSGEAVTYANSVQHKVILIDGKRLTELMIEYGIGVSELKTYSLKKIDFDYFSEDV
jgi:restriction system protein